MARVTAPKGRLTFRRFLAELVRVPDDAGTLSPLVLHPEQDRVVTAIDRRRPDGLRQHREVIVSWPKKGGKSTTLAAAAVWLLTGDDLGGADREVVIIASDLAQSRDVVFTLAGRIVQRHPWLASRCKVGATEITFTETVTDRRTGGRHRQKHVLRAVPQDIRGLHGANCSGLIVDETWVLDDYAALEALAPSPARKSPLTIYGSYAGLQVQQRVGVPWFDLLARARRGDDPQLFCSHLSGPDAWRAIPWCSEEWVASMRRLYETCPAKYIRLVENRPAAGESGLLTATEIEAAVDHTWREPVAGTPGQRYVFATDLGTACDWSCTLVGHVDGDARFVVDAERHWVGTPERPVSLEAVEQAIVGLAARFKPETIRIDRWQALLMAERLQRRSLPVRLIAMGPTQLDGLVTALKAAFAARSVRLPGAAVELIEQLESLQTVESRAARRNLVKFAPSGRGAEAGQHDDLAICLAMCLQAVAGQLGQPRVADLGPGGCPILAMGLWSDYGVCFLADGSDAQYPPGPTCKACPSWLSVRAAFEQHLARGGADLRWPEFVKQYMKPSTTMLNAALNRKLNDFNLFF